MSSNLNNIGHVSELRKSKEGNEDYTTLTFGTDPMRNESTQYVKEKNKNDRTFQLSVITRKFPNIPDAKIMLPATPLSSVLTNMPPTSEPVLI